MANNWVGLGWVDIDIRNNIVYTDIYLLTFVGRQEKYTKLIE